MREIITVLVIVAVVGLLEALLHLTRYFEDRKVDELRRRLQQLGTGADPHATSLLRQGKLSSIAALDALLRSFPLALRLETLLVQANTSLSVAQFLGFTLGLAGTGIFLGQILAAGAAGMIAMALIGAILPLAFVIIKRDIRSAKISEQLPDALDMMSRALRAGHSIVNSFQFVAIEMPEPISLEFGRAFEEQRVGRSLDHAVVEMTRRTPQNRDLKILVVSILVQKDTGGNLTEILEKIAETIRSRYRFYGKLRSLTAEGRMSALVLASLPIMMFAFLALSNLAYLMPLFESPLGLGMLAYAVLSWGIGLAWMYRMTKVEF